jgi:hypothetical protein
MHFVAHDLSVLHNPMALASLALRRPLLDLLGTHFNFPRTPFFSLVRTPSEPKLPSQFGEFDCVVGSCAAGGEGG